MDKLIILRCSECNKIIAEAKAGSTVRVKCKCGTVNSITLRPECRDFSAKQPAISKERQS